MSENRIRKTDTTQVAGPASAGIWVTTAKALKYNPDGTTRDVGPITFSVAGLGASSTSLWAGIAPCKLQLVSAVATFGTASSSGTFKAVKAAAGTAIGSATDMTSTGSLAGTANTPVTATNSGTAANLLVAAGEQIGVVFGGTMTSLANCAVTLTFRQV